jgi:hypothetical protein
MLLPSFLTYGAMVVDWLVSGLHIIVDRLLPELHKIAAHANATMN